MMLSSHERPDSNTAGGEPNGWHRHLVCTDAEGRDVCDQVEAAMNDRRYPLQDVLVMRLALDEAIVNALRHGHRSMPGRPVQVSYLLSDVRVLAEVVDEGPGFDPHQVPDPFATDMPGRSSGWGLFLMRNYLSWVRFNERGNAVTLCRRRTDSQPR
jgi:serine/threonine-protein kinase RsbW